MNWRTYIHQGWLIEDSLPADYAEMDQLADGLPADFGVTATHMMSGQVFSYRGGRVEATNASKQTWYASGPLESAEARVHILTIIESATCCCHCHCHRESP